MLELSRSDARRLLAAHHFTPGSLYEIMTRLGSVQFDPLNPVGRNHDLVLQARVPGYKVGDWQKLAYEERFLYDAWDKQASLVLMQDWPQRRIYHTWQGHWWDELLRDHPDAVETVLAELRERGPLTSTAFEYQLHKDEWQGSWYGPKLTKHVLRSLWHSGKVLTHGRKHGHHVYDLTERVVPPDLYNAATLTEREMAAWLIRLRHRALGLLRPNPSQEVWSLHLPPAERRDIITSLVATGELVPLTVEGVLFHVLPETLEKLETAGAIDHLVFVAPLDQLVWDRKAVKHLFDFEYLWEVYVPEPKRRWGYYVLPVFYRDRFVARFDSRLKEGVWEIYSWYWEPDVTLDLELLGALTAAVRRFMDYLGAERLKLPTGLTRMTRSALQAGAKG